MHAYTEAVLKEMRAQAPIAKDYTADTVFFGGGTPILLPLSDTERLMKEIRTLFTLTPDAEITMEANPGAADEKKLSALRALGINRLSIGVQSLSDKELRALGRVHNAADAIRFFRSARASGFENINVDLMYGIPYQTQESFSETLDGILSLQPEHISAYSLIIEEGTPFFTQKETLSLPSEDEEDAFDKMLSQKLALAGYRHYEVSNFSKEGYASRHNLHYWRAEEYLGFGVSAYSFFGGARYGNGKDITAYMALSPSLPDEKEVLSKQTRAYEYIMLRLRLDEGVDTGEYERLFGVKLKERYREEIARFKALGFMKESGARLFLTERGMRFSNTVLVAFMEDF